MIQSKWRWKSGDSIAVHCTRIQRAVALDRTWRRKTKWNKCTIERTHAVARFPRARERAQLCCSATPNLAEFGWKANLFTCYTSRRAVHSPRSKWKQSRAGARQFHIRNASASLRMVPSGVWCVSITIQNGIPLHRLVRLCVGLCDEQRTHGENWMKLVRLLRMTHIPKIKNRKK